MEQSKHQTSESGLKSAHTAGWQHTAERVAVGLGYELVDCERGSQGLLRVYIDRVAGRSYDTGESECITVDDCEKVTRQLQYALEVEGCDYSRLEVSSPGLDRPLKKAEDFARFSGVEVDITLKQPFQGRKKWRGLLAAAESPLGERWRLILSTPGGQDQALDFELNEVREARLVPVVNFKGRAKRDPALAKQGQQSGGPEE